MFNSVFKTGIYAHYTPSSTPSFTNTPWVVYTAKSHKTKQQVSLFKFDKKLFEQFVYDNASASFSNLNRSTYKLILAEAISYVKAYVNNLIKFKHPNILSVIEPLEERQNSLIFVTELVTSDLNNFMKGNTGKEEENQLILINGLLQICGALNFLHNNANIIHLNIFPPSIFITEKLDFKLSGFNYIQKWDDNGPNRYDFIAPDERFPKFLSINFDYTDPTLLLDHDLTYANDIFSLGCVIYYALNAQPGKSFFQSNNDLYDYKAAVNRIKTSGVKFKFDDSYLAQNFNMLIDTNPQARISIEEFKNSSFFNNELLNSLDFVNNFNSKTLVEKNIFLKGFNSRNFYEKFPKFLLIDKFLPILKETISNIANIVIFPITLTCIFKVSKNLSNLSFVTLLLDVFKPIPIKSNKKTVELNIISFTEIQIIILDNLKHILNKINTSTSGNFKKVEKSFLVPLINNVLADGAVSIEQLQTEATSNAVSNAFNTIKTLGQVSPEKLKIQEKFLANLSLIISTLQNQTNNGSGKFIETEVLPKVLQVFKQTGSLTIRVEVLKNFIKLTKEKVVSSAYATKKIIPLLIALKLKNNQLILQALLEFYTLYLDEDLFDKSLVIDTILPELLKVGFNNNELTIENFNEYFALITKLQNKLKEKHIVYLEKYNDKNIIKKNTFQNSSNSLDSPMNSPVNQEQIATFESLVNGGKTKDATEANNELVFNSIVASPDSFHTPEANIFSGTFGDLNNSPSSLNQNLATSLNLNTKPLPSQPTTNFSDILTPSNKKNLLRLVSPSINALTPTKNTKRGGFPDSSSLGTVLNSNLVDLHSSSFNALQNNSRSSTPVSTSSSAIDWSLETTKINAGKLTLSSNNVLKPKSRSASSTNVTQTNNSPGFPPGFSAGLIQPKKAGTSLNSHGTIESQYKKASDNFFDSFL